MCLDHVRQLTRSRKWKHKGGRRTSHSYWSRTHGPRWTTHGTYGRRPWLWRVSRRGDLSPAGCRGSFSRCSRSENGGGSGTEGFPRKLILDLGFPPRGGFIGEGGPRGSCQVSQEGAWRPPPLGRATHPPGWLAVAPGLRLGYSGGFRRGNF